MPTLPGPFSTSFLTNPILKLRFKIDSRTAGIRALIAARKKL
jgi:hypothetical protein